MKSWFMIDGTLEPIEFSGPSHLRFPGELARLVIERYSDPGDWVLDPFCGFGTTIDVGQSLERKVIGFERNIDRGKFAAGLCVAPSRVIVADIRRIEDCDLPQFDLLFTSPPFASLGEPTSECIASYLEDFRDAFMRIAPHMRAGAKVVVELSNVRNPNGIRTLLWDAGKVLASIFHFEEELVRCNTGKEQATAGFDHSTLVVLSVQRTITTLHHEC